MSDSAGQPKMWGGRFAAETDALVERLNNSLAFDARLWRQDIAASIAHAAMLGETGILTEEDSRAIQNGLRQIESELETGQAVLNPAAEDIHTAIEALLAERIGPVAGRLHTARSRNDQVATDTRLYLREAIDQIAAHLASLQAAQLEVAEASLSPSPTLLPGCTHLQHAQPVLLAHHLLAYFWMLQRDRERLAEVRKRVNRLPLGAGALAGVTFPIRRERVAELLGFEGICENSLDAVSDRDFALEFLSAAAILMVHLSRFAEEIIIWNSPEYGYIELDDSVTTGSSIMPQKKNPDVAELARGKSGRVFGSLMALLTVMKGLPLAYNKDMQEDKEPLFDTVDTLTTLLPPFEKMLRTARFNRQRMEEALKGDFSTATDIADLLVRSGMTFRDAHGVVGRLVRESIARGTGLEELTAAELESLAPGMGEEMRAALSVQHSVEARSARGGTAPAAVREQIALAKTLLPL